MSKLTMLGRTAVLISLALAGCAEPGTTDEEVVAAESASGLKIGWAGMNPTQFDNPDFPDLFSTTSGETHLSTCHGYAPWEIALDSYRYAHSDVTELFDNWYKRTSYAGDDHCTERMVTFKAWRNNDGVGGEERYPYNPSEFKNAFLAFRKRYPGVTLFTAWNEPNNRGESEAGLWPEDAAQYYLALRSVCRPSKGCLVATGDILGWSGADDFQERCDHSPDDGCANGSYLDQFKFYIRKWSGHYGLGRNFVPEFVAYHPWWDSFQYSQLGLHCYTPESCATRGILENLHGKWSSALLWATEVGADQKDFRNLEDDDLQACTVSYLQRVFALSPRITRFYYFDFCGITAGQSSHCEYSKPARALKVLRDREQHFQPFRGECP